MNFPIGRLVDAPDPSATVRYDFNDKGALAPRWITRDFTLGVPPLLTAPDAVSPMYGFRSPGFGHVIHGEKSDALAALAVLSRELLRPTNWLLFQVDAVTRPVWFRLYPTGPEALSLDNVYTDTENGDPVEVPDLWEVRANFTADAFGYGERITLDPVTVTQSLDGDNPMRVVLPTIHGDAPTALRVAIEAEDDAGLGAEWLLGCTSGDGQSSPVVPIGTGDGFTTHGGAGAGVTDAAFFDGSYRPVTLNAADPVAEVLTGDLPAVPGGSYEVWLRCEADAPMGEVRNYQFAFGQVLSGLPGFDVTKYGATATEVVGNVDLPADEVFQGWVDLGEFTFPFALALPADVAVSTTTPAFSLKVGEATGLVGEVRLDAFLLIPVGGPTVARSTMLRSSFVGSSVAFLPPGPSSGVTATFDGDDALYWATDVDGLLPGGPRLDGGFPVADPGAVENWLHVVAVNDGLFSGVPAADAITNLGSACTVTYSYRPRLLHLDGRP